MDTRTRNTAALLLVTACQASVGDLTGFGATPGVTSAAGGGSSGDGTASSSGGPGGTTTEEVSSSGSAAVEMTGEPPRDLGGMPDFGDGVPAGCEGKIDFLFVISREPDMGYIQGKLAAAVPKFIDTIETKFANFDYHIMVVDGDGPPPETGWGDSICNTLCPNLDCKVGESCCPIEDTNLNGKTCCTDPNYPCDKLDLVTTCDHAWGAGTVFPAGTFTADKPCAIDGGRRYLVKGQTDLAETFECIARVGNRGYGMLGRALTAAVHKQMSEPGGCNPGFLRKDALLMVTMLAFHADTEGTLGSEGTAAEWAKAVTDAKHGDAESVVMLNIGGCQCGPIEEECHPDDRLCLLASMFPYHLNENMMAADYGPAFLEATSLVETACAGFVAPG